MKTLAIKGEKIQVKAVGFDKDGTLFDAVGFWSYINGLRKLEFLRTVGMEFGETWERIMGFRAPDQVDYNGVLAVGTTKEAIVLTAGAIYQLKGRPWIDCKKEAESIFHASDARMSIQQAFRVCDGAKEVFLRLKEAGLMTGILTSDKFTRTDKCMELLGVEQLLDFVITPEHVEKGKPSPDMVLTACGQIGISPEEMAVIGDSLVDMEMAKEAGSIAVGIVTYDGSEKILSAKADFLINSLNEIIVCKECM